MSPAPAAIQFRDERLDAIDRTAKSRLQSDRADPPVHTPKSRLAFHSTFGTSRLLKKQPQSTIVTVSSGLAFVPLAPTPTYCATKAAIHSYTQSLRYQLKDTTAEVVELIPPYVATDLMGSSAGDPRAMPLGKFIAEVMEILKTQPDATEICVENVKRLRFATESGHYDAVFKGLNDAMATGLH